MNTFIFVSLVLIAEVVIVWLAYCMGHDTGWLDGWEQRGGKR